MRKTARLFLLPGILFYSASLLGQGITDSIHALPEIEVKASHSNSFSAGIKIEKIDSLSLLLSHHLKLSDLLDKSTVLYTKNYGAGNMSTLSFRGTSASQSAVFWNGFNLKAPGSGMIDLSLIPLSFFSVCTIQYAGADPKSGATSIGGAIQLGNNTLLGKSEELSAGFTAGSFDEFQPYISWKVKKLNWGISTSFQHNKLLNNFPYSFGEEKFIRSHAAILQTALLQSFEKQWNNNHLDLGLWLQQSNREIPASVTSADLNANREDKSLRFTSRWKNFRKNGMWSAGLAVFHDFLHYSEIPGDTLVLLDSKITNNSLLTDVAYTTELKAYKTLITAGGNISFNTININKFGGYNEQQHSALFLSINQAFYRKQWQLSLSTRKEFANSYFIPFAFSAGLDGNISHKLILRLHAAKNHRIPAMNDRFWMPGGNPDLKPETAVYWGGGLNFIILKKKNYTLNLGSDIFSSDIINWIGWSPSSSGYFTAMNLQYVKIKGYELTLISKAVINNIIVNLMASCSILEAINQKKLNVYDLSQGKQLIYTPSQRFTATTHIQWKNWLVSYNQSFTGKSFTNRENTDYVNSFTHADFLLRYAVMVSKKYACNFQAEVSNVWDTSYEVDKYFPMPGRAFHFGVNCDINYSKK